MSVKQVLPPIDIEGSEVIGYAIFDPDHVDSDGKITTAAFTTKQLDEGSLSVCRILYSSIEEIQDKIISPRTSRKPDISFCGVLTTFCQDICNINNEEITSFFAKSDPLDGFPSHGLIGFTEKFKLNATKSKKTQARAELMRIFGNIKSLKEVFP
ncbi:MAG: hypothetical protein E6Q33_05815 [Neisseriales bacterium]|nr:MAG: hypothetical protein E6Q33_05815 [Neisseriales bacterium]